MDTPVDTPHASLGGKAVPFLPKAAYKLAGHLGQLRHLKFYIYHTLSSLTCEVHIEVLVLNQDERLTTYARFTAIDDLPGCA